MKRILQFVLSVVLLTSCTKQESTESSQIEIKFSAGINNPRSKTAIDTWTNTPVGFAKGISSSNYTEAWNAMVSYTGYVNFLPTRYYPNTAANKVYLKGYAPQGVFSDGIITFPEMNGTQDILLSNEQNGSISDRFDQPDKGFAFSHSLAQLNFTVIADSSFPLGVNLTHIIVNGTNLPVSMNVATGVITYATTTLPITSFVGTQSITSITSDKLGTIMVEPNKSITLTIIAGGVTYNDIAPTIENGIPLQAGTAYTIALTFKSTQIAAMATITPWKEMTGSGMVI